MANISTYISQIMSAVYGEEVRGSIRDALNAINNDVGGWHNAFIDGFAFDTNLSHVYLCSTAAGTADKVINVYPEAWLNGGSFLIVQFENTNTANPEDLNLVIHDPHNVNPDITLPIMHGGEFLPSADCLKADRAYLFAHVNDSITTGYTFRWELIGDLNGDIDIPDAFNVVELLDSNGEVEYTIPVGSDKTLRLRSGGIIFDLDRTTGAIEINAPDQFKQFTSGQTSVQANRDNDTLNLIAGDGVSIECSQANKSVTISSEAPTTAIDIWDLMEVYGPASNYTVYSGYRLKTTSTEGQVAFESAEGYSVVRINDYNPFGKPLNLAITLDYEVAGDTPESDTVAVAFANRQNVWGPAYVFINSCNEIMTVKASGESPIYESDAEAYSVFFTLSPGMDSDLTSAIEGVLTMDMVGYLKRANAILSDKVDNVHVETIDIDELVATGICEIYDNYILEQINSTQNVQLVSNSDYVTIWVKDLSALDLSEYSYNSNFTTLPSYGATSNSAVGARLSGTPSTLTPGTYYACNGVQKVANRVIKYSGSLDYNYHKSLLMCFYKDGGTVEDLSINGTVTIDVKKLMFAAIKKLAASN